MVVRARPQVPQEYNGFCYVYEGTGKIGGAKARIEQNLVMGEGTWLLCMQLYSQSPRPPCCCCSAAQPGACCPAQACSPRLCSCSATGGAKRMPSVSCGHPR